MIKKYYIITFGCQMNKSDSERIADILEKNNYKPVAEIEDADLIIVNMCSVRQSAVDRIYGLSNKLKKIKSRNSNLITVLTGCILEKDKKIFKEIFSHILNIKDFPKWIKNSTKGKKRIKIIPKKRKIAYIPISNGCNNFCSYCVVPYTRGRLKCKNHKVILNEVKKAIKNSAEEIWLLGQNVNDYHSPANPLINFAKLLKMVNEIEGDFKLFFTSPHPKNFSEELIKTMAKCEKMAHYLNLPVQSGDNEILRKMNRNYTVEEYKKLVEKIRKKIPDIYLSTDVIVGFPGETKKQFQNTIKLFKEIKFNNAYIAKYSPRPGTAAFKLKNDVPFKEKKRRENILRKIIKES